MPAHRTHGVKAGATYFAVVFAAGFVLGTVRVLLLIPRFGALPSVLLELPLMLAISWIACGWVLRRFQVPPRIAARLSMGAIAFALLMLAEVALSLGAFGGSMSDYLEELTTPHGLVGLAGQLLFALMPLARRA
ncbi:MAG: hypothetical protein WBN70_20640 [Polyangiales bacterium]